MSFFHHLQNCDWYKRAEYVSNQTNNVQFPSFFFGQSTHASLHHLTSCSKFHPSTLAFRLFHVVLIVNCCCCWMREGERRNEKYYKKRCQLVSGSIVSSFLWFVPVSLSVRRPELFNDKWTIYGQNQSSSFNWVRYSPWGYLWAAALWASSLYRNLHLTCPIRLSHHRRPNLVMGFRTGWIGKEWVRSSFNANKLMRKGKFLGDMHSSKRKMCLNS